MEDIKNAMNFAGVSDDQQKKVEVYLENELKRQIDEKLTNAQKAVCPECKTGKHGNCDGKAGITDDDQWIPCSCVNSAHAIQHNNIFMEES